MQMSRLASKALHGTHQKCISVLYNNNTAPGAGGKQLGGWNAGGGGGGGASLTEGQRVQIQELEQRDADFDRQLDEIGEGIADLGEIAALQSEEVKHQSLMLDHLE